MEDYTYLWISIIIAVITFSITVFISIKKDVKKIFKYIPAILLTVGSIAYCILMTAIDYSKYIGILYIIVFAIVLSGILLSLVTAILFDIISWRRNRIKG